MFCNYREGIIFEWIVCLMVQTKQKTYNLLPDPCTHPNMLVRTLQCQNVPLLLFLPGTIQSWFRITVVLVAAQIAKVIRSVSPVAVDSVAILVAAKKLVGDVAFVFKWIDKFAVLIEYIGIGHAIV